MTSQTKKRSPLKIIAWVVGIALAGAFGILFWPFIGLIAAVAIPLLVLGAVVRSMIRELRGKRETYTVTTGKIGLSHLPTKPERIRHFTTKNENPDE